MKKAKLLTFIIVIFVISIILGWARILVAETPEVKETIKDPVERIAQEIIRKAEKFAIKRVAVVEFLDIEGKSTRQGKLLAERLTTKLVASERLEVIERSQLNKVLQELKLSLSGIEDVKSAKKIGKILDVEAIVSGTIVDLKEKMEVNARMINTETGKIMAAVTVRGKKERFEEKVSKFPETKFVRRRYVIREEYRKKRAVRMSALRNLALLDDAGNQYSALNRMELHNYWRGYYGSGIEGLREAMDKGRTYEKVMFPRRESIYPGGKCKGYVAFPKLKPGNRNVTVIVPLRIGSEDLELRFNFTQKTIQK